MTLNYRGLEKCEAIQVYRNGMFAGTDTTKTEVRYIPGDGRLVVGRHQTGNDLHYANVKLDELMMFNAILSEEQIRDLSAHA